MWYQFARFILKFRLLLLLILIAITAVMGFLATKVELSYEFAKAIPATNARYIDFMNFKNKFGDDGNTVVIGVQTDSFFSINFFNAYNDLQQQLKKVHGVEGILSITEASDLVKNDSVKKLQAKRIFYPPYTSRVSFDSAITQFSNLPFYEGLLYNPEAKAYIMAVRVNRDMINSKARTTLINNINEQIKTFKEKTKQEVYISGLPFIRTSVANRLADEMNYFLIGSFILSAISLLLFFRSFYNTLMSLLVVGIGVVWSLGTMVMFGYNITILTALIPPLIVVIGVPNCIYFLNKYHMSFRETGDKKEAILTMISRMSVVTLFCNIAAAIGFGVFYLTSSELLKEFGLVAGINILLLFIISAIFIPASLSYLPAPTKRQMKYLDSKFLHNLLEKIHHWAFNKSRWVYGVTALVLIISIAGFFKLNSVAYIVDDLPAKEKIYTDLKWFETNFGGIMPLEIVVDSRKKKGLTKNTEGINGIDAFSAYIDQRPETAKPLSFVEGLKFAHQAYYDGDSLNYSVPTEFDFPLMSKYLKADKSDTSKSALNSMLQSFIDSNSQVARISVNMKDIGSAALPAFLKDIDSVAAESFDTSAYKITFTGSSITFLEGVTYIINGLKESIFWAFLFIAICMIYLFRSFRIVLCSLIPNAIPLIITAGVMGWANIPLKPSTVLIFSVALGIVIDVTIRFLINYRQQLKEYNNSVDDTLSQTIRHTGISIIYTSVVLVAGFIIFCLSDFGGTRALGWLTSLTLITGTITNLLLLPVLLRTFIRPKKEKQILK